MRSLLRLAWRSLWKNKLRTALVVALIAVPVTSAVAVSTLLRTLDPTIAESDAALYGPADAIFNVQPTGEGVGYFPSPLPARATTAAPVGSTFDPSVFPDIPALAERLEQRTGGRVHAHRVAYLSPSTTPYESWQNFTVTDADLTDPALTGVLDLVQGRLPTTADEVALTVAMSEGRQATLGNNVDIRGETFTVVGLTAVPSDRKFWSVALTPNGFDQISTTIPWAWRLRLVDAEVNPNWWLLGEEVFQPPTGNDSWYLNISGPGVTDYRTPLNPGERPEQMSTLLAAAVAVEIALIAAAAFAVGTRRRVQEFGQLLAMGADGRHIRKLLLFEAGLQGLLGAALGSVVGVAIAGVLFGQSWLEPTRYAPSLRFSLIDVLGPAVVALLAALVAAWFPARTASKLAVTSALAGRLPTRTPNRHLPKIGLVLLIGGTVLLVTTLAFDNYQTDHPIYPVLLIGAVAIMFAGTLCAITHALHLVAKLVGRLSERLPVSVRLIARNSDRQRARAGAAVAAFVAIAAVPVLVGSSLLAYPESTQSNDAAGRAFFIDPPRTSFTWVDGEPLVAQPPTAEVAAGRDALRSTLRSAALAELDNPTAVSFMSLTGVQATIFERADWGTMGYSLHTVAIATPKLVEALGVDATVVQGLSDTQALVLNRYAARNTSEMSISRPGPSEEDPFGSPVLFDVVRSSEGYWGSEIGAMISPEAAERLRIDEGVNTVEASLVMSSSRITDTQVDRIRDAASATWTSLPEEVTAENVYVPFSYDSSFSSSPMFLRWLAVAAMAALAAIISLIVASLAAVEADKDFAALVANGASPSIRRWMLGAQTTYHMIVAAALGIPLALLIMWAVTRADTNADAGLYVPWTSVAAMAVGVPLVVGLVVALLFRSSTPAVSRRLT